MLIVFGVFEGIRATYVHRELRDKDVIADNLFAAHVFFINSSILRASLVCLGGGGGATCLRQSVWVAFNSGANTALHTGFCIRQTSSRARYAV